MGANILDTTKRLLPPDLVEKTADEMDESTEKTATAMRCAVPTTFAAIVQRAAGAGGAQRLAGILALSAQGGQAESRRARDEILGERGPALAEAVARKSGIGNASASRVLATVFPVLANVLGKRVLTDHLDGAGLTRLLIEQKRCLMEDRDTPPLLGSALGLGAARPVTPATPPGPPVPGPVPHRVGRRLPLLVLAAIAAAVVLLLARGPSVVRRGAAEKQLETPHATPHATPPPAPRP